MKLLQLKNIILCKTLIYETHSYLGQSGNMTKYISDTLLEAGQLL